MLQSALVCVCVSHLQWSTTVHITSYYWLLQSAVVCLLRVAARAIPQFTSLPIIGCCSQHWSVCCASQHVQYHSSHHFLLLAAEAAVSTGLPAARRTCSTTDHRQFVTQSFVSECYADVRHVTLSDVVPARTFPLVVLTQPVFLYLQGIDNEKICWSTVPWPKNWKTWEMASLPFTFKGGGGGLRA